MASVYYSPPNVLFPSIKEFSFSFLQKTCKVVCLLQTLKCNSEVQPTFSGEKLAVYLF